MTTEETGVLQRFMGRLARFLVGHPVAVLVFWGIVVAASTPWALQMNDVLQEQGASKVVPGSTGEAVAEQMAQSFPWHSERETLVVLEADDVTSAEVQQIEADLRAALAEEVRSGEIVAVSQPQVSDGEDVSVTTVAYAPEGPDPDLAELRSLVRQIVADAGQSDAVHASITGELALIQDTYAVAEADNAIMEYAAYVIIFIVLLLFFRAVVPTVLTLVTIGLAMNVGQAWLYVLGREVTLTQFTVTIMTFVMLGAGVDYSMLLSSRYRQERLRGLPVRDAVISATAHAGESVALAGAAVVVAFGSTLLAPVDWIPPLGYGGLIGVPIMLVAALTITPCLLILLGDRFFALGWKPLSDVESRGPVTAWLRGTSSLAMRFPLAVVLTFVAITVPLAWVVAQSELTSDPVALSPDTDALAGYETVTREWGPGVLMPTNVVGTAQGPSDGSTVTPEGFATIAALTEEVGAVPGVASVRSLAAPAGQQISFADVEGLPPEVVRDYLADDGTARLAVELEGEPLEDAAQATVHQIEDVVEGSAGTDWAVGGSTVVDEEYNDALVTAFWRMVALVSIGVFLLLMFALRSVLIPVRLIVTIMMSNVWALAVTVLVFDVWKGEVVINDLPVFLVILMMGLGMDYEIFLMTRVRDLARRGLDDRSAITGAVSDTGRVITAAGLVMAGSLGAMMLSSTLMLQQYGLGLGVAVLLDATLIRMLLVPASFLLFKSCNWWMPRWLGGTRVTPDPQPVPEPVRT